MAGSRHASTFGSRRWQGWQQETVEAAAAAPFALAKARLIAGTPLVPQGASAVAALRGVDPALVAQRVDHACRLSPAAAAQPLRSAPHGSLERPRIMEAGGSLRETSARAVHFSSQTRLSDGDSEQPCCGIRGCQCPRCLQRQQSRLCVRLWSPRGVRAVFRGLRPTFFRDVVFSGTFFPLWLTFQPETRMSS